jgi:hypothetical protein
MKMQKDKTKTHKKVAVVLFTVTLGFLAIPTNSFAGCDDTACETGEFDTGWPCTPVHCYYAGTTCGGRKDVYEKLVLKPSGNCYEYIYIGCGGCSGSCFAGDTMITTPDGEKVISELEIGEKVLSLDTETNEIVESQVENLYSREVSGYYKITLEDEDGTESLLKVTGEHPLLVGESAETAMAAGEENSTISRVIYTIKTWVSNLFK